MGVRRFPTLPYAHKPGVATHLNDWAAGSRARCPIGRPPSTPRSRRRRTSATWSPAASRSFKMHLQVGEFHLDDPLLDGV